MPSDANQPPLSYEVKFDPAADRRLNIDIMKEHRKDWIFGWLKLSFRWALLIGFLLYTGSFHTRDEWPLFLLMASGIGILLSFAHYWEHIRKSMKNQNREFAEEVWACELSAEAWSFVSKDGVRTSIPWRIMEIEFEHPYGWLVNYGRGEVIVYRRPLQDAGLEEEFLSRIPEKGQPASGAAKG